MRHNIKGIALTLDKKVGFWATGFNKNAKFIVRFVCTIDWIIYLSALLMGIARYSLLFFCCDKVHLLITSHNINRRNATWSSIIWNQLNWLINSQKITNDSFTMISALFNNEGVLDIGKKYSSNASLSVYDMHTKIYCTFLIFVSPIYFTNYTWPQDNCAFPVNWLNLADI